MLLSRSKKEIIIVVKNILSIKIAVNFLFISVMKIKDLFTFIFYSEDTMSERSANIITHDPFGSLLGYAPGGVAIYSSDYNTADDKEFPNDAAFRSYLG